MLIFLVMASSAFAADDPFAGRYSGTGRACFGGLYVRAKTLEWNSTYSLCKSTYEILEQDQTANHLRIVYHLMSRGDRCRYSVIALQQISTYGWALSGYPSLEAFQKRDVPNWRDSDLPERQSLFCPMIKD